MDHFSLCISILLAMSVLPLASSNNAPLMQQLVQGHRPIHSRHERDTPEQVTAAPEGENVTKKQPNPLGNRVRYCNMFNCMKDNDGTTEPSEPICPKGYRRDKKSNRCRKMVGRS